MPGLPRAATVGKMTTTSLESVLRSLRWGLHAMFYLLLFFGLARAVADDTLKPLAVGIAAALALVYALPTLRPGLNRGAWLGLLSFLWLGLMFHEQDFMWLEFPLLFLYLHYLPRTAGLLAAAAAWATAAFMPAWRYPESWSVATAVGPAIGTAFAIAVYYSYVALREETIRYRDLATQLRRTQAKLARSENHAGRLAERTRLRREMHDTVTQGLSSILLLARAARAGGEASPQLRGIEEAAAEALDQARALVTELADEQPADADVEALLRELVDSHRRRAAALEEDTSFELVVTGRPQLAPAATHVVERVAREGLNNAARHALAHRVVVTLSAAGSDCLLDVVDDGIGRGLRPDGDGLTGLRGRVEEAGGTLTIESSSAGTALSARVPRGVE